MYQFYPEYFWNARLSGHINEAPLGGSSWGEIQRVLEKLDSQRMESWSEAWGDLGWTTKTLAEDAEKENIPPLASARFLRASTYLRAAELFLADDDPYRKELYTNSIACFRKGLADKPWVEQVEIPFEGATLPGYFVNASKNGEPTPTVYIISGVDGTAEMMYFSLAQKCPEYGISALVMDGPGNGGALKLKGLMARFDYEKVATAAYDFLAARSDVAEDKIAILGASMGGYYCVRAAAFEHRFCALVVFGACYDYGAVWRDRPKDHRLWPHALLISGTNTQDEAIEYFNKFVLAPDLIGNIQCPTLILHGENDVQIPASDARKVFDELAVKDKSIRIFTAQEGGDVHCQLDHATIGQEAILSWLYKFYRDNR